jgi:hypothetical protein
MTEGAFQRRVTIGLVEKLLMDGCFIHIAKGDVLKGLMDKNTYLPSISAPSQSLAS